MNGIPENTPAVPAAHPLRQEVKLTEAIGKTLEGVAFSHTIGQAVLTFTDGTFATLGVADGPAEQGEIEECELVLHDFGDDKLISLGITTDRELRASRGTAATREHEYRLHNEILEYARLKRKFEE